MQDEELVKSGLYSHQKQKQPIVNMLTQSGLSSKLSDKTNKLLQGIGMQDFPSKGSNNWVLSGKKTRSGKPILANDPHLGLAAPSVWYLAELKGPSLHVIGATLPGVPFVVIGHNDKIAWGVTNSYVNEQTL